MTRGGRGDDTTPVPCNSHPALAQRIDRHVVDSLRNVADVSIAPPRHEAERIRSSVDVRGLRYHCRCWGDAQAPKLFLLHGWMDVSASFQFLVDALRGDWQVIAPDWRGYGLSHWGGADGYWFPDYMGDLDGCSAGISSRTSRRR